MSHNLLNGRGLNDKDAREPAVTAAGLNYWHNASGKPRRVISNTTPTASASGYAVGCEWLNESTGIKYINTGSAISATWSEVPTLATAAPTFAGNVTVTGTFTASSTSALNDDVTVATNKALAVTTADKLTVGGIIVPQSETVRFTIMPHASQTTYTIFNNRSVGWTVTGITVVPDLAQGGALTATLVKATANAAPSSGTTPLHTANAIDCNATANTSQVITLTTTGADLILAATDKIGIVFSAALSTGILSGTITLKRS